MVPVRATLATPSASRGIVAPLDADRYLLKVTISGDAHAKLDRIRDLLRHSVPNGDPSVIVERALSALLENLQKSKHAETRTPRVTSETVRATRHIPAAVKRAVWARDGGRCAFIGADERCPETGFLEYHHVIPFAAGGTTTVENLELRCRAHNGFEADRFFGRAFVSRQRDRAQSKRTLSGQSSRPAVRPSG
jgi:5-methylcytosine-specific restriction endonuclease McrA